MRKPIFIISVVGVVVLVGVTNVLIAARRAANMPAYWDEQRSKPLRAEYLSLVALGDSTTLAIGTSHPSKGFVGRCAEYMASRTGKPVHIANVSKEGASLADVVTKQIPRVDLERADIILVSAPSDFERRLDPTQFAQDLDALLAKLPADKSIISDLPLMPGREPYQEIVANSSDARSVLRAHFAEVFNNEGRRLDIFSWLLPHLNDKGHAYWFKAFEPEVDIVMNRTKHTSGVQR